MKERTKNILAFGFLMAMAAFIYLWYYPLDTGKATVSVGLPDYWVTLSNQTTQCPADPCVISVKTGNYELKIRKDGYFPESAQVEIKRFGNEAVAFQLKKVPTLVESLVVPVIPETISKKPLPKDLDSGNVRGSAWDSKGEQLAFLDKAEEKVKVWSGGTAKTVTPLKMDDRELQFYWAPNNVLLAGVSGKEIYFIDTQKASRKKGVLGFDLKNPLWNEDSGSLLVNDGQGKVYKIGIQGEKPESVNNLEVDLDKAVWSADGKLVYFKLDEKGDLTQVIAFDPATGENTVIVSKYGFPVSKITKDVNGSIYLYNPTLQSWSVLEY